MRHSHFTHDADGRVICLDTNLGEKKIRLVNVYAPATRDKLNSFYTDLEAYLLTNRQLILGRVIFNCVLDSARDTRSTGPPPSTLWCTKALRALVTTRGLADAWPLRRGTDYVPTWHRGASSSRLDRFYLSHALEPQLHQCEVLNPSVTGLYVSDNRAGVITLNVAWRRSPNSRPWKLSSALLSEPVVVNSVKEYLRRTLPNTASTIPAWEGVKDHLRNEFVEWGKRTARSHTQAINSVAAKIRILARAPTRTALVESDLEVLRARHIALLQTTSPVARLERFRAESVGGSGVLRYLRSTPEKHMPSPPNNSFMDLNQALPQFTDYFRDIFQPHRCSSHRRTSSRSTTIHRTSVRLTGVVSNGPPHLRNWTRPLRNPNPTPPLVPMGYLMGFTKRSGTTSALTFCGSWNRCLPPPFGRPPLRRISSP
ncbi:unnamed protein product [Ixodes hexagonus]